MRAKPQNNGGTCQLLKNTIPVFFFLNTKPLGELKDNCDKPWLSEARDSNDQLCKDVDLLDSHIRGTQTCCNLPAARYNSISMNSRVKKSTDPVSSQITFI